MTTSPPTRTDAGHGTAPSGRSCSHQSVAVTSFHTDAGTAARVTACAASAPPGAAPPPAAAAT